MDCIVHEADAQINPLVSKEPLGTFLFLSHNFFKVEKKMIGERDHTKTGFPKLGSDPQGAVSNS